jgi:hypothetical protein
MRQPYALPPRLETVRRRFEIWRRTRQGHRRIPESLWTSAVELAGVYGLCRTARVLRLDYPALKRRVQAAGVQRSPPPAPGMTFVELVPPERSWPAAGSRSRLEATGVPECILECENVSGAKMRVHLKGAAVPDLLGLSRSFWSADA